MATKVDKDESSLKDDRGPPDREIDKLQAIRHLLHTSIRMLFWDEDPFALHVVSQSCDKLITDCIKQDGHYNQISFDLYIKDEHLTDFYRIYREIFNYLKHADKDRLSKLGVRNIVQINETNIFMNVSRLNNFYGIHTVHMKYFINYMLAIVPENWLEEPIKPMVDAARTYFNIADHTRADMMENMRLLMSIDPAFVAERAEDLTDVFGVATVRLKEYHKGARLSKCVPD